jgi:hypothetical protein
MTNAWILAALWVGLALVATLPTTLILHLEDDIAVLRNWGTEEQNPITQRA